MFEIQVPYLFNFRQYSHDGSNRTVESAHFSNATLQPGRCKVWSFARRVLTIFSRTGWYYRIVTDCKFLIGIIFFSHVKSINSTFSRYSQTNRQFGLEPPGTSEIALLTVRVQKKKMILCADVEVAHQCMRGCLWNVGAVWYGSQGSS